MTPALREQIGRRHLNTQIVHASILMTVLLFLVVVMVKKVDIEPNDDYTLIFTVLIGLSAVSATGGIVLYQVLTSPARMGKDPSAAYGKWLSAVIIRDSMFEAIAAYGLVLYFLGGGLQTFLAFGGAAAFLLLMSWPTFNAFTGRLEGEA